MWPKVVFFLTGMEGVPIGGYDGIPEVSVLEAGCEDHLPDPSTCHLTLKIPPSPSEDKFFKKFDYAVTNALGYGRK